jgi:hypothetical protein
VKILEIFARRGEEAYYEESIGSSAVPSAPKKKTKKSQEEETVKHEHYENLASIETKSMVKIEIGKQKFEQIKIDVKLIKSPSP